LFVVGDSAQTIYSWRGADHRNMQKFSDDFPAFLSFELRKNYRSDAAIIEASRSIINKLIIGSAGDRERSRERSHVVRVEAGLDVPSQVTDGPDDMRQYGPDEGLDEGLDEGPAAATTPRDVDESSGATGEPTAPAVASPAVQVVCAYHDVHQAEYIAHMIDYLLSTDQAVPGEVAIMYRRHSQSDHLQSALFQRRIRYTIVGGTGDLERKEVKDALAYLRLLANPRDGEALRRVINYPPRGVGAVTQTQFFSAVANATAAAAAGRAETPAGDTSVPGPLPVVDLLIELGLAAESMKEKAPPKKRSRKAAEDGANGQATPAERLAAARDKRRRAAAGDNVPSVAESDGTESMVDAIASELSVTRADAAGGGGGGGGSGGDAASARDVVAAIAASLGTRQLKALHTASTAVAALRRTVQTWQGGVAELVDEVLTASGLRDHIRAAEGVTDEDKEDKLARVQQLVSAARLFDQDVDVGAAAADGYSNSDDGEGEEVDVTGAMWRLRRYLDSFQLTSGEEATADDNDAGGGVAADPRDGCVRLMTLHASKGLEFDCVFIAGLEEKTLPLEGAMHLPQVDPAVGDGPTVVHMVESPELQLDEERRLLYVGVTRARRRLFLCYRERHLTEDGRVIPVSPSRFLKDLPEGTPKIKYRSTSSSSSIAIASKKKR